jgi:branched-chain amino acid aminotransferase
MVAPRDAGPEELVFGCIAAVASGRRNPRSITAGLKTLAYTESVAAAVEAHRGGANESIFLDTDDHCSEATASNLFVCMGDELLTPPVSCGVLPGVTREAVMEVARAAGLRVDERPFGLDQLTGGDEAFLTSSLRGVAPLLRVGGEWIGSGRPGARTGELAAAYDALLARECAT